jgi:GIY-YIG catalytic domain
MIHRDDDKLRTKVYRKPTHTQAYINWRSNHPNTMLLGVFKDLVHRANYFCDREEDLTLELKLLRDVLIINGYPQRLVRKTIERSQERESKKEILKMMATVDEGPDEEEENYYGVLHAPYMQNFTERIARELKKFNVGWVLKKRDSIRSKVQALKPSSETVDRKGVIYRIDCEDCNASYIGETGQMLKERLNQHMDDVKNRKDTNGVFQHLRTHKRHKVLWDKTSIIDAERNWDNRNIKEALFINAMDPFRKNNVLMNLEKGWEINPIWNVFNPSICGTVGRKRTISVEQKSKFSQKVNKQT